jgi:2'-5' RNA ligase
LEQQCRRLQSVFSEHISFNFILREPRRYRNYVYFAPEPIEPFLKLAESARAVLPEVIPYRVMFGCVTPHLTVAYSQKEDILQRIHAGLTAVTIESTALNIELMEYRDNAWKPHMRFPLGLF